MRNYELKYPIDFNLNLEEIPNFVSENKNVLFELNAIKYRYFILNQLIEVYDIITTNAKKTIDLINSELKK